MSQLVLRKTVGYNITVSLNFFKHGLRQVEGLKWGSNFSQGARIVSPNLSQVEGSVDVIQHCGIILLMLQQCFFLTIIEACLEGLRHCPRDGT